MVEPLPRHNMVYFVLYQKHGAKLCHDRPKSQIFYIMTDQRGKLCQDRSESNYILTDQSAKLCYDRPRSQNHVVNV